MATATSPASAATAADPRSRYEAAFGSLDAPFAFVDLDAMWRNSDGMLRRAGGKPIRIASKSVRCRRVIELALERDPGYRGLLTFTLPETLWLAEQGFRDLVVAYPTADRRALSELRALTDAEPNAAPVVMVDCAEHLEMIEAAPGNAPVRVCIDLDMGFWLLGGRVRIGPKRSPIRTPEQAVALAGEIQRRDGVRLVGLMGYEGHIAGVGDRVPGKALRSAVIRRMQRASAREIAERRGAIVAAVREVAELEFVNGGGTGSLEGTAAESAVTELTAGSGFFAPLLFDTYSSFDLEPAAMFALPIVRRPGTGVATALGGGYLASGAGGPDRMPRPHLPAGLKLDSMEGTGEVQTPLLGSAADRLAIGDRVYFRHVKAGELCERFDRLYLVAGAEVVDEVPTYRGEGKTFL